MHQQHCKLSFKIYSHRGVFLTRQFFALSFLLKFYRNDAVSPLNKLLMTLRFYATGSFFMEVGDFIGPEKSTTMRHIWTTTRAIVGLRQQHIYMPRNNEEIAQIQGRFYNMARFPRVIGVVDGTFIRIQSPGNFFLTIFGTFAGNTSLHLGAWK